MSAGRPRQEWVGWGLLLAALLLVILWIGAPLQNLSRLDHCPYLACDFQVVYLPQAQHLYEGFVHRDWNYPPILAILLQPLAFLPVVWAVGLWTLFQVALIGFQSWCIAELLPGRRGPALGQAVALQLLCLPVIHSLKWGQVSMALGVAALCALRWGGAAGALLGLAAAVKLYPVLWLAGLWRDRRGLGWAVGGLLLGLGLPLLMLPWDQIQAFHQSIFRLQLQGHAQAIASAAALGGQGLQVSLYRWFVDGAGLGAEQHGPLLFELPRGIGVLGMAPLLGALVGLRSQDSYHRLAHLFCGLTLALQPGWHHYYTLLPLVWALGLSGRGWSLSLLSVGLSALPLLLLPGNSSFYALYTTWGGTTATMLLAWAALLLSGPAPSTIAPSLAGPRPPEEG